MHEDDIGLQIKQINDQLSRLSNAQLKMRGLTLSQMRMLDYLNHNAGHDVSQHELEEYFQVAHPTVIGIVKRLEKKGFVSTSISTDDHRVRYVTPTKTGRDCVLEGGNARNEAEQLLLAGFSAEEARQFHDFLGRAHDNLTEGALRLTEGR